MAKSARKHVDHRLREVDRAGFEFGHISCANAAGDKEHAHVADDLGRGRHLHDVAEELVDLGIGTGDFAPAVAEAHRVGLLAQVRVLTAGHFVFVHFGGAGARRGVEGFVKSEHFLPVIGEHVERVEIKPRIAFGFGERGRNRIEVRLRG